MSDDKSVLVVRWSLTSFLQQRESSKGSGTEHGGGGLDGGST